MKPMRRVFWGLLLIAIPVLPALPELGAQYTYRGGPICPYAMSVTHVQMQSQQTQYYQQMQQQQMMQQQQQMHYQSQMMQQQQRQQQMMTQQQRLQTQQQQMQTKVAVQQQHVARMNVGVHQVNMNQFNMHIPTGVGHHGTSVPRLSTHVQQMNTTVAHLNTGVHRMNTSVQTVSTRVNQMDTSVTRMKTGVTQLNTGVQQMSTKVQKLNTNVTQLNTNVKTVCTGKEMTIVTINYNCMSCHSKMKGGPQPGLQNPVVRQNNLPTPVARMPIPQLPNPVAKQMPLPNLVNKQMPMPNLVNKQMPMPNLVAKMQPLPMFVDPRVPQLPTPVMHLLQLPVPVMVQQPLFKPVAPPQQLPQMVQLPQLPPLGMPVTQDSYFRPGLLMLVTKSADLYNPTSPGSTTRKPTSEPISTWKAVTKSQEPTKTGEAPRMMVMTKEMLDLPVDLPMPTTQTPPANNGGRLNLGAELVQAEDESPTPTRLAFQPVNDDERARPSLSVLPRSVWLAPLVPEEAFEDYDRNPPVFAGGPGTSPVEEHTLPVNTTQSSGQQSLDAPPLLALPTSVRTPG